MSLEDEERNKVHAENVRDTGLLPGRAQKR